MNVNWEKEESHLFLNPRLPLQVLNTWGQVLQFSGKNRIWLATSGSKNMKLVSLKKESMLLAAKVANDHLQVDKNDIWLNPLPHFHVGGLSIFARGFLSNSLVISYENHWNPLSFFKQLVAAKATLTSLVPTQVYDLVQQNIVAPKTLRAVLVGGGAFSQKLYEKARGLGWPLLPTYGMTENASQVATANLDSLLKNEFPKLKILPHVQAKTKECKILMLKSDSLLEHYAVLDAENNLQIINPLQNGWFETEDLAEIEKDTIEILGRKDEAIKIGGELVNLKKLQHVLEDIKLELNLLKDVAIEAVFDERLGYIIGLISTYSDSNFIVSAFNEKVMPYERIRNVKYCDIIPRSPLGKLLKS